MLLCKSQASDKFVNINNQKFVRNEADVNEIIENHEIEICCKLEFLY